MPLTAEDRAKGRERTKQLKAGHDEQTIADYLAHSDQDRYVKARDLMQASCYLHLKELNRRFCFSKKELRPTRDDVVMAGILWDKAHGQQVAPMTQHNIIYNMFGGHNQILSIVQPQQFREVSQAPSHSIEAEKPAE